MTLQEIKDAVEFGKIVHWSNHAYRVIKDTQVEPPQWLIFCDINRNCIGLTWRDGQTLNGKEDEFFCEDPRMQDLPLWTAREDEVGPKDSPYRRFAQCFGSHEERCRNAVLMAAAPALVNRLRWLLCCHELNLDDMQEETWKEIHLCQKLLAEIEHGTTDSAQAN